MSIKNYHQSSYYEIFIRRAYQVKTLNSNPKFNSSYYDLLFQIPEGRCLIRNLTFTQQLEKVKNSVKDGISKLQQRVKNRDTYIQLNILYEQTNMVHSEPDLHYVIMKAINVTRDYKDY